MNFFTNTDEGIGGCQTGGAESFPCTKREVLGGTKIRLFEFEVEYSNFGATYLSFGAIYLNFDAIYLNFGAKNETRVFLNGVGGGECWGGSGWVPQDLREISSSVSGKIFSACPLSIKVCISIFSNTEGRGGWQSIGAGSAPEIFLKVSGRNLIVLLHIFFSRRDFWFRGTFFSCDTRTRAYSTNRTKVQESE